MTYLNVVELSYSPVRSEKFFSKRTSFLLPEINFVKEVQDMPHIVLHEDLILWGEFIGKVVEKSKLDKCIGKWEYSDIGGFSGTWYCFSLTHSFDTLEQALRKHCILQMTDIHTEAQSTLDKLREV